MLGSSDWCFDFLMDEIIVGYVSRMHVFVHRLVDENPTLLLIGNLILCRNLNPILDCDCGCFECFDAMTCLVCMKLQCWT